MNKVLNRIAITIGLLAVVGCGSSDKSNTDALVSDAGDDAAPSEPNHTSTPNDAGRDSAQDAGKGAQTSTTTVPAANSCADLSCKAPATCEEKDGKASCHCPSGYSDLKGDGSQCDDKDECANEDDNDCDRHASCENKAAGYECKCKGPAYTGDGKSCNCADGFKLTDGECLAPDGNACGDNLDCQNNHCVSGICCATECGSPGAQCLTDKGATCEDGHTCKYPVASDGSACEDGNACTVGSTCKEGKCQPGTEPMDCDDKNPCTDDSCDDTIGCKNQNNTAGCDDSNPCTENDKCGNGSCSVHTARDCSAMNGACTEGKCDPADGACKQQATHDGMICDDANSCTAGDKCNGGMCAGANACGPNATACAPGATNSCTCASGFHDANGKCVPMNDECATNNGGCDANADCLDTSNDPNTVSCTCKPKYTGDGKTCVLANPCENNPCGEGRGTCTNGDSGAHTCSCNAGFTTVAGQCVCDLSGTFAARMELALTWSATSGIEAGNDKQYSWSIERHSYDAQGNLGVEIIACGETNVDLCGTGIGTLVPVEAYAQYTPINVWDHAGAASTFNTQMTAPIPGSQFQLPAHAALHGLTLSDPLGAWPATRKDIEGAPGFDGSAVNGARWIDTDNDSFFGLTTFAVGPAGVAADGSATAPLEAYGTTSKVCPRSNPNGPRSPYNYAPAAEGLSLRRVKRFSSANRVISGADGTINSCDLITGNTTGIHFDTRVGSCVWDNNGRDQACSDTLIDFLDMTTAPNQVDTSTFVMKRLPDAMANTVTCAQVRALSY